MDPSVVAKHIQLYVNDYTIALDERAVHALLQWQQEQGATQPHPRAADLYLTFYFLLFTFQVQTSSSSGTAYALGTRFTTMVRPNSTSTAAAAIPR